MGSVGLGSYVRTTCMCDTTVRLVCNSLAMWSLPGLRMAITFDFLHSFGNFCIFSIEFIICSNHRRVASPKCLICSQSISSRPAALLFFKALTPCRRSSIKNGDDSLDSVTVCLGIFSLRGTCSLFPLPFRSSW